MACKKGRGDNAVIAIIRLRARGMPHGIHTVDLASLPLPFPNEAQDTRAANMRGARRCVPDTHEN